MVRTAESEYDRARVRHIALSAARAELDELFQNNVLSAPLHARLKQGLDADLEDAKSEIAEMYKQDEARAEEEIRTARKRLMAAEKGAIHRAVQDGLVSPQTAATMIDAAPASH